MSQVKSRLTIKAPLDVVWPLAQEVEKFPEFMPDLDKVRVLQREQASPATTRVISEWEGRIKQFNRRINWTEEDIWNVENHSCSFWQLKGDFNEYRGEWTFADDGQGGTTVDLQVEYRFEIPLIGTLMQKVLQKLMQSNADNMLAALKSEAERRHSG